MQCLALPLVLAPPRRGSTRPVKAKFELLLPFDAEVRMCRGLRRPLASPPPRYVVPFLRRRNTCPAFI